MTGGSETEPGKLIRYFAVVLSLAALLLLADAVHHVALHGGLFNGWR